MTIAMTNATWTQVTKAFDVAKLCRLTPSMEINVYTSLLRGTFHAKIA